MDVKFILQKSVDKSLLKEGFTVPVKVHAALSKYLGLGSLEHGEKRNVTVVLEGQAYVIDLASCDFDRTKYPRHQDIWRFMYSSDSSIARRLREIFLSTYDLISSGHDVKDRPVQFREYLVLYATDVRDLFYLEPIANRTLPLAHEMFEAPSIEPPRRDELRDVEHSFVIVEAMLN